MKRLTYISEYARYLTKGEIERIGEVSVKNNSRDQITGALLVFDGKFFQILEGDDAVLEQTYQRILDDPRHTNVLCLNVENQILERRFPDWGMKVIQLDESNDILLEPVKSILSSLTKSHRILEAYTQPTLLDMVRAGADPLKVTPSKADRIVMFSDVVSFTSISESRSGEDVHLILDTFFTAADKAVLRNGGQMNKYTGDGFLAYFDGRDGDRAVAAALDLLTQVKEARHAGMQKNDARTLLHCGIGMARGMTVLGNFGGGKKLEYTLHGDAVNTASRLQDFSRKVPYHIILTDDVRASLSGDWTAVSVGRYTPRGKLAPVRVLTIDHPENRKQNGMVRVSEYVRGLLRTAGAA